ncbi:uncharacterized protein ISCGN_018834 [Ixodes scapularis]
MLGKHLWGSSVGFTDGPFLQGAEEEGAEPAAVVVPAAPQPAAAAWAPTVPPPAAAVPLPSRVLPHAVASPAAAAWAPAALPQYVAPPAAAAPLPAPALPHAVAPPAAAPPAVAARPPAAAAWAPDALPAAVAPEVGPPKAPPHLLPLFSEMNDETHLGYGVMIPTRKLNYMIRARGDSIFCKEATKAVFGAANLQRRSVTWQPCRWLKGAAPKRALTPERLVAVGNAFDLYIRHAHSDVSPKKRKRLMNKYIAEQLQDTNRKLQL